MPNGRCRMHGGMSPGAPKGNKNAFKHGFGTLQIGAPGDVAIMELVEGPVSFVDPSGKPAAGEMS
jgi:hypothetical protein